LHYLLFFILIFFRSILRTLTEIISYRQKEIIHEVYRYIYPIEKDNHNEYSIVNIILPQADDKIYQSASSSYFFQTRSDRSVEV
jgi:hypothetical protein